ncbi:MAG: hypothetical protein GYA14_14120 [Ignavibacteria bacterium]|nr:hypothetical protein [Ignavibacteria bacterium]
MDWNTILKTIEQVGLGGLAVVGLVYIAINFSKNKKNNGVAESLNHISDNFREISKELKEVSKDMKSNNEKLNTIITDLAILLDRTKDNGK